MKLINGSNNYIDVNGTLWLRDAIVNIRLEKNEDTGKDRLTITNGLIYSYVEGKLAIKEFLKNNFRADTINEIKAQ